ncbi:hypothetical protein B0J13DRAFT_284046 [Dactylonectria estremocensis]|uniref:Secreted protein n=1 Tax=Dactylonectria estremocensis TaxID=1079267 RepID=A0A9P9F2N5_9HYPO|nr:hypothetical protein B0J13DRAFT_284046 [Dactylonectria estremocensis]
MGPPSPLCRGISILMLTAGIVASSGNRGFCNARLQTMAVFPIWHQHRSGRSRPATNTPPYVAICQDHWSSCFPGGVLNHVSYHVSCSLSTCNCLASAHCPLVNLAKVSSASLTPRSLAGAEKLLSPGVFPRLTITVSLGEL